jgi:hypothetical protein
MSPHRKVAKTASSNTKTTMCSFRGIQNRNLESIFTKRRTTFTSARPGTFSDTPFETLS